MKKEYKENKYTLIHCCEDQESQWGERGALVPGAGAARAKGSSSRVTCLLGVRDLQTQE